MCSRDRFALAGLRTFTVAKVDDTLAQDGATGGVGLAEQEDGVIGLIGFVVRGGQTRVEKDDLFHAGAVRRLISQARRLLERAVETLLASGSLGTPRSRCHRHETGWWSL